MALSSAVWIEDAEGKCSLSEPYTNIKIPYTDLIYYIKLHLRKKSPSLAKSERAEKWS